MKTCSIDDCDSPQVARSWCAKHYQRWHHHGSPELMRTPDGLGVCECPISKIVPAWPGAWQCQHCGFPSIHRMASHIRSRALARQPHLACQIIGEECAA